MNNPQRRNPTFLLGILNKFLRMPHLRDTKSIRINPHISKYWEFRESKVLVTDTKSNMTSTYCTNFFIIIRHYK